MSTLADRITAELRLLIGQPIVDCWRAVDMQMFEFGTLRRIINRKGDEVEAGDIRLHIQCRWRLVDGNRIIFGRDDLYDPADASISLDEFDYDKQKSVLDVVQRQWFSEHRAAPLKVTSASGDAYGGFQIYLQQGFALEVLPCGSAWDKESELWRLFGHKADASHFVVTEKGIEDG